MKKAALTVILAIAMIVCMIPIGALTALAEVSHTHKDATGADVTFEPIDDLDALKNLFQNGGSGYLTTDIDVDGDLTVAADVNLCLNDKVLNLKQKGHISVSASKNFALYDCGNTKRYYDKDSSTGLWTLAADQGTPTDCFTTGGVITGGKAIDGGGVYNKGTVTMYAGNIAGNTASSGSSNTHGGGVFNKGTFTMYNGSISGNAATGISVNADGGGVYMNAGTFTMYDGSISDNTSSSNVQANAGGVYMNAGTFTMKKGAIDKNTVSAEHASAGGVLVSCKDCIFMMEDGSVSCNTANGYGTTEVTYCGGVFNKGTFTMKNGHIDNNTSYSKNYRALGGGLYVCGFSGAGTGETIVENGTISNNKVIGATDAFGGGVYIASNRGLFTMKNGIITGNVAQSTTADTANGGGIFSNGAAVFEGGKVTGNMANYGGGLYVKSDNFTVKNGEFTGNTAVKCGGGVYTLSGAVLNLTADAEKAVSITGNKAETAVGGVIANGELHLSGKIIIKENICTKTYNGTTTYPANLAACAPLCIDGALTGSEIRITHASAETNEHDCGVLTKGYTIQNKGAGLEDFFRYDGPYCAKLNKGEIEIISESEEPTSPKTGDNSNVTLWVMLLALSSMALVLSKKRKSVR